MTKLKPAVFVAVFIGVLVVSSVTILPALVKNRACEAIRQATGRTVGIESVSINPFTLAISAKGVVIKEKVGDPFVSCAGLSATISPASIFKRLLILEDVTLESPSFSIIRTAPDRYSFSDIIERLQAQKKPASQGTMLFSINNITVTNGSVHFSDAVPTGGFKTSLNDIDLDLKHFTTAADTAAEYKLSLLVDNDVPLTSGGSFSLSPLAVRASIELTSLNLEKGWPYLDQFLTAPLKGILNLAGEFSYCKDTGLVAENGRATVLNLSTRYGNNEGLDVSSLAVSGVSFKQNENSLEIGEAKITKGNVSVSRETDGKFSVLSLLAAPRNSPIKILLPTGAKSLSYRLKRIQGDRLNLRFSDKSRPGKPTFSLRDTSFLLANLNGPHFTPAQLRFSSTYGAKGRLKGSGDLTPYPFRYMGDIVIDHLPIKDFSEYFPENLNFSILDGNLYAEMKLDIAIKEGTPRGSFKGKSGVRAFHCVDKTAAEDLLKWESLQLDGFQGGLEPFRLDVREIALNGVYSRIIIRKDGTLNLQNLLQKTALTSPPALALHQDVSTKKRHVNIGAVTIQDGTLSFSDNRLAHQFATTIYNLGGRVSGLSSEAFRFADVDLRGNLESQSPLQITGRINPLRNDLFVDLKVSFHDIELSPVSPYSGSYLGYTVEKGKLFLDLKYHIENNLLTSDNKIFIDQFTFGSKVESGKATSLPAQLILALLKDRKGEIHLDVPVSGLTDDPKFSIWKLVFQAFKNMMVKVVTSPLSFLSSAFGSGEDFSAVPFDYGTSVISIRDQPKLDALSKALLDRPALKVELKGYVDREKDIESYRRELLNRKLKNEKLLSLGREGTLKPGDTADTIQLLPEEYATYLAAVYKKEKFPKPRNVLGLIKTLHPGEMNKLIIANTIIGEPELKVLARERVDAVASYLVNEGNVPDERIFQVDDDIFKAPENDSLSRNRVEINAIVQ